MLNSTENFLTTARKLSNKSNGKIKIIAGIWDYQEFPFSDRKQGFIDKSGKLVIDPSLMSFFDVAKTLRDEKLTAELDRWSRPWFENMHKDGSVFGYVLPTWGLHYVLKVNAPDSKGDWGLTNGPNSYFWGGIWMGINKNSKKKELAWKFVEMMTLDKETVEWWAKSTGDFVGNQTVINEIKDSFSEPYLNGQNYYKFFAGEVPKINADIMCIYEQKIRGFFMKAIFDFVENKKTKDEAIVSFKENVKSAYPSLISTLF